MTAQPPLVDDGYLVEPEPVDERVPWHGWEHARHRWADAERRPISHRAAVLGLAVCVALLATALLLVGSRILDATPSSSPESTLPVDLSGQWSTPATSGAPHEPWGDGPRAFSASVRRPGEVPVSGAPQPSGGIATALVGGWATYCDPTPTRCQSWAPPALLGAVPWFRDGDAPFGVQVCVDDGARCVAVQVVSFCACGDRDGIPTVIDLSRAAFEQLAPASRGVVFVTIEWPVDELPMTSTEEEPTHE